jgi:1,4-dihydroxy-2-naphthoate octaprenyltransferase
MKSWSVFIQGGVFLVLISLSLELMRTPQRLGDPHNWPEGMTLDVVKQVRWIIAMLTATFLTVATAIVVTWMQTSILWPGQGFLIAALLIAGALDYLSEAVKFLKPFGLLFEVLVYVVIPPAFAYFLQSDDPHRLLTMVVIALVPSYLANRLLTLLKRFGRDQKYGVETLVTLIGWENSMFYHNALILLTYLLYALVAVLGFPWFLIWPVFLTLPIGLTQIWLMERVKRGMKPLWQVMQVAAACVLFIPVYLLGFAFWIR